VTGISRRGFMAGVAAASLAAAARLRAEAQYQWKLGASQPADSPNCVRLSEMAERVRADTGGRLNIEVFPESRLGSDSAMLDMVHHGGLELYLGGNVFGPLVPVSEMPGLPFVFKTPADVFAALDGEVGNYIRKELLAAGLYAFRLGFDNGFHQITTSTRPIESIDDVYGLKIRTPVQSMNVEYFQSLGAVPKPFTLNRLYAVLKDHTVDAQTDPMGLALLMKLYEVQTCLSITNHWWSGFTLVANAKAWAALPTDIQAVVNRHAEAAALAQREDIARLNARALDTLRDNGMTVNETDTHGFRKQLDTFYARWRGVYGEKAWALLEARTGKLM
jgi:tripartite ATP-independent transporter DctP family solute receptor